VISASSPRSVGASSPSREEPPNVEPNDLEVLGAYTLEGFGLGIDPIQRRLIPGILYGA